LTLQQLKYIVAIDRQRMLNTITETLLRFMPDGMMEEQIVKYGIKL
jgi:LysR family hydrogen peroxide-inducible transcriptional activator